MQQRQANGSPDSINEKVTFAPAPKPALKPTTIHQTTPPPSSFAVRVVSAGDSVGAKKLWGLFAVICLILLTVYPASYYLVEYGVLTEEERTTIASLNAAVPNSSELTSKPLPSFLPMREWNDREFLCYLTVVMWITMVLTGLGTEVLVWIMFIKGGWNDERENLWWLAQFFFPMIAATSIGLANTHNWFSMPLLVLTAWKFGFPETVLSLHTALYDNKSSFLVRFVNFLSGAGTVIHHSASALYVAAVCTNLIPASRFVIQITVPLLMQHWFVLLRYNYNTAYVVLEVVLEVWFQWTAFGLLKFFRFLHWTGSLGACGMILAHWMYFTAGFLSLFTKESDEEDEEESDGFVDCPGRKLGRKKSLYFQGDNSMERLKSTRLMWVE